MKVVLRNHDALFAIMGNVTKVRFMESAHAQWIHIYQSGSYSTTVFVGDGITAILEGE